MVKTVEDIRKEFEGSFMLRQAFKQLKKEIEKLAKAGGPEVKKFIIQIIKGEASLNDIGKAEATKKFGMKAEMLIGHLAGLTEPQRQYILEELGWDKE